MRRRKRRKRGKSGECQICSEGSALRQKTMNEYQAHRPDQGMIEMKFLSFKVLAINECQLHQRRSVRNEINEIYEMRREKPVEYYL